MSWLKVVKAWINHIIKGRYNPDVIPVSDRNLLVIMADIKKGTVAVSYKGHFQRAYFEDNTLRNLVKGIRFEKSSISFFGAVAQLIIRLTKIINTK